MSNKIIGFLSKNRTTLISTAVGIGAGYILGYRVRDSKYEIIISDEDSNADDLDPVVGEFVSKVEALKFDASDTSASIKVDIERQKRKFDEEEWKARNQQAIIESLKEEGVPFEEYQIKDDGFPTYPSGKPDPKDIVVSGPGDNDPYLEDVLSLRNGKTIYPLSRDEFFSDEKEYDQVTLSYYSIDDVLTDQEDGIIPNYFKIIGDSLPFGMGSPDPNTFYIRNEELRTEYEIIKYDSSFVESILGIIPDEDGVEMS